MFRMLLLLATIILPIPLSAQPLPVGCEANFAGGTLPAVDAKHSAQSQTVCYRQFAILHSALTKTPVWSAEHLTAQRVGAASGLARKGTFHAETRIPAAERADLIDYKGSGYDRGHMSPSGDMPDGASQQESFSLANMVPQAPCNNEVIWEQIESAVRGYVTAGHDVFVVTGPIYDGATVATIGNNVAVPTRIFKAIFEPKSGRAGVYVTANNNDVSEYATFTLAELQEHTGIDAFPSAPSGTKGRAMELPLLSAPHHACRAAR